jgi:hypothetical protein
MSNCICRISIAATSCTSVTCHLQERQSRPCSLPLHPSPCQLLQLRRAITKQQLKLLRLQHHHLLLLPCWAQLLLVCMLLEGVPPLMSGGPQSFPARSCAGSCCCCCWLRTMFEHLSTFLRLQSAVLLLLCVYGRCCCCCTCRCSCWQHKWL